MDIILPFLAIAAAWGVRAVFAGMLRRERHRVSCAGHGGPALRRASPRRSLLAPVVVVLLMLSPSLLRVAVFDQRIGRPDTRSELRAWLLANVPPEQPILWSGGWTAMPYMLHHRPIRMLAATELLQPVFLHHPEAIYDYRWIVLVDWPRTYYLRGRNARERAYLASTMAGRYELMREIDLYKAGLPPEQFCVLDHFYMSYPSPWLVERPGPAFRIYRRVDE